MEQGKRSRTHKFAAAACSVSVSVSPNYFQMVMSEFMSCFWLAIVTCTPFDNCLSQVTSLVPFFLMTVKLPILWMCKEND